MLIAWYVLMIGRCDIVLEYVGIFFSNFISSVRDTWKTEIQFGFSF